MKITVLEPTPKPNVPADSIMPEPEKKFIRPSHRTYMRGAKTQFSVYINDIMVFNHRGPKNYEGNPNGAIPMNHLLLKSGVNNVVGKIYPEYGKPVLDRMSTLELCYYRNESGDVRLQDEPDLFVLDAVDMSPNGIRAGLKDLPYFEISKTFHATVPFELEGWTNSVELHETDEELLIEEVILAYQEVHKYLKLRDADKLIEMQKDFLEIRLKSFYFTNAYFQEELAEFRDMIADEGYEVAPLPESAFLHFYAYGKIVTLLDQNANPIIRLVNKKDPTDFVELEFKFHKKKEGDSLTII